MNYRDALQIVIGEASRLNDKGDLSDLNYERVLFDVNQIDGAIAAARSASRGTATGENTGGSSDERDTQ